MRHLDLDLPRLGVATLALAAGVLLAGCSGYNSFAGPDSVGPTITNIAVPPTVGVGDTLDVQLSATGATGVAGFSISLRGVVNLDTLVEVSPAPTVTQAVRFALPTVFNRSTSLVVSAGAIGPNGGIGKVRSATIAGIVVPPQVVALQAPDTVLPGSTLELSASAVGFTRVKEFLVRFRGAFQSELSVPVATPDTLARQAFQVQVPTVLEDTALSVEVQPVDESGAAGEVASWRLPVRVPAPEITDFSLRQDTVRAGGVLDLHVQARSLRRVQYFNIYLRGGVQTELLVPATPARTSVDQDIPVPIPTGVRGTSVSVRIAAVDGAGTLSAERVDSARIALDVPTITRFVVSDTVRPGGTLDARVEAEGPRRIARVDLSLRGAFETDVSAPVDPLRTSITQDVAVPLVAEIYRAGFTSVLVFTKVVDESGAVSAIDSTWVPVIVPPDSTAADSTSAYSTTATRSVVVRTSLRAGPHRPAGIPGLHPPSVLPPGRAEQLAADAPGGAPGLPSAPVDARVVRLADVAASPGSPPRSPGGEGRQIPWPRVYTSEE